MRAFVSGGCGQVGSHVVELLLARGDDVLAIDNFATGRREHLGANDRLRLVEGSIADTALITGLFEEFRPSVVVHTAASYKDPDDWIGDALTNVVGGVNLIQAAKRGEVERFIYFQTALCYGTKPLQQPIPLD